jgi:hypothetical protein
MQLVRSIRIISIILLIVSLLSGCASVQAPSTGVTGRDPLAGSPPSGPWTFAVLCDTRGDSNPANLDKSGVNMDPGERPGWRKRVNLQFWL